MGVCFVFVGRGGGIVPYEDHVLKQTLRFSAASRLAGGTKRGRGGGLQSLSRLLQLTFTD
jgi:hypothetical protein